MENMNLAGMTYQEVQRHLQAVKEAKEQYGKDTSLEQRRSAMADGYAKIAEEHGKQEEETKAVIDPHLMEEIYSKYPAMRIAQGFRELDAKRAEQEAKKQKN